MFGQYKSPDEIPRRKWKKIDCASVQVEETLDKAHEKWKEDVKARRVSDAEKDTLDRLLESDVIDNIDPEDALPAILDAHEVTSEKTDADFFNGARARSARARRFTALTPSPMP